MDIGKAIDKQRDDLDAILAVTSFMADHAERQGVTRADVDAHMGTSDMGGWWLSRLRHRCQCPQVAQYAALKTLLSLPDDMDAEVWRLNGRKGTPGEAWATAEVLRTEDRMNEPSGVVNIGQGERTQVTRQIKAPATDAARRWDGWGTALKPSQEIIVAAVKPQVEPNILDAIGSHLERLAETCKSPVTDAPPNSVPTQAAGHVETIATAPAHAATPRVDCHESATPTGEVGASFGLTATSASELQASTYSNIVTSWSSGLAALSALKNTSTTETTTVPTIDPKILLSCLSRITDANTLLDPTSPDGLSSLARAVDSLFGAAVWSWSATLALSAAGNATGGTPTSHQGAAAPVSPASEPVVVARKPLIGTVAANVAAHGVGGLNIDGCRVGTADSLYRQSSVSSTPGGVHEGWDRPYRQRAESIEAANAATREKSAHADSLGRWPANVILTHAQSPDGGDACADGCVEGCPVRELDEQSGTSSSVANKGAARSNPTAVDYRMTGDPGAGYTDTGGASRFFPTFRYVAKADSAERIRVTKPGGEDTILADSSKQCNICGKRLPAPTCSHNDYSRVAAKSSRSTDTVSHPTVKPLELMRWLVRLVTPKGGVCLDLFAGSGTTGEAAILEGCRAILIEREPDYLPLIVHRLTRRLDPVEYLQATGAADGTLFGDEL